MMSNEQVWAEHFKGDQAALVSLKYKKFILKKYIDGHSILELSFDLDFFSTWTIIRDNNWF